MLYVTAARVAAARVAATRGCCDPGCCGPGCCAARFRRGCAAASRSDGRGRSAPGARVPHSSFRGGVAEPGIHGVRRLAGKPNPMDSRFRGNDGVFRVSLGQNGFRLSQGMTAFSSGIGKLFVMPGRQVIRHSRVGTLFVMPGRRSRTRNPWGSSIGWEIQPHGFPLSRE